MPRYYLVRNRKMLVWPWALAVLALLALIAWFLSRADEEENPWERNERLPRARGVYVFRGGAGDSLQPGPLG